MKRNEFRPGIPLSPRIDVIIIKFTCAISFRIKAYSKVSDLFGFLSTLEYINEQELRLSRRSEAIVCTYQRDFETSLTEELVRFAFILYTPLATKLYDNNASKVNMTLFKI